MMTKSRQKERAVLVRLNNNKEVAYQSVFHSHVHLIPRYSKEDDFSIHFGNHQEDYSAEAMQEIAETIAKQVN